MLINNFIENNINNVLQSLYIYIHTHTYVYKYMYIYILLPSRAREGAVTGKVSMEENMPSHQLSAFLPSIQCDLR